MRRLLSSLTILQLLSFATTAAFTIQKTASSQTRWCRITTVSTATELTAKKSNKRKSAGGMGFGGSSSPATKSSSGTKANSSGKIRSVSGYTGSGTKALRAATNTFDSIIKACDGDKANEKEALSDVYVKSPSNDPTLLWFTGKVVRRIKNEDGNGDDDIRGASAPTEFEAVISQKRLILEWAKNELRPQNLGGPNSKDLEIWIAPGNSEMDSVQNKTPLTKVVGSIKDLSSGFSVADVGFNPEIYLGDEKVEGGLRIRRDLDGQPMKPEFEINQ